MNPTASINPRRLRCEPGNPHHPLVGAALLGTLACLTLCIMGITCITPTAEAEVLIHWDEIDTEQLQSTYLALEADVDIEISALATFDRQSRHPIAYPWILDAQTRRVRWTVDPDDPETRLRRMGNAVRVRVQADTVHLAAGEYEVYYATYGHRYQDMAVQKLFGKFLRRSKLDLRDEWELLIETGDADRVVVGHRAKPKFETLARIPHPGDSAYEYELFRLDAASEILVYAIGEYDGDSRQFVDAGWIADAQTRRTVWEMKRRNTKSAGGGAKNRRFRGWVQLDAGTYMVGYSSDDSHSYGDWNVNPPYDPEFWGIALFDPRGEVAAHWTSPVEDPFRSTLLVDFNRQRDGSLERQGLRLSKPLDLFVMSLGEQDNSSPRFVDFGWIESLPDRNVIWTMTRHNTRPAGGSEQNRMADETIRLDAGDYIVGYVTDSSHAFGDWNKQPPRNPDRWGIQVSAAGDAFDRSSVKLFDPEDAPLVLAELLAQGDDSDESERFELEEPATVRIASMGEGLNGHMFDYGRLRRLGETGRQGRVVWKMYYDNSRHAGGADKNRVVEEIIDLPAGRYEIEYVSDDSHSFDDWNSSPPDHPHLWGIQVYRLEP